jgi:hypothetical protein
MFTAADLTSTERANQISPIVATSDISKKLILYFLKRQRIKLSFCRHSRHRWVHVRLHFMITVRAAPTKWKPQSSSKIAFQTQAIQCPPFLRRNFKTSLLQTFQNVFKLVNVL